MYPKSADFWCIGAGKQGFELKNKGDVPRKNKILGHHFFYGYRIMQKNCSKGADIGSFYLFLNVFRAKAKCNLLFFFMYFTVG